MWTLGIDIGGTFTDLVLFDGATGEVRVTKVPSDAADPVGAVARGLADLATRPDELETIVHGTTVTTNALLQRRGARTAVVTTEGFRDLLEIGRTTRGMPGLFNTKFVRPEPLVPRELRLEVRERVLSSGEVLVPLEPAPIAGVVREVGRLGAEAVAVCLVNAYRNPAHEEALVRGLRERLPRAYVVASTAVIAEYREYERFNTTAVNAFLGPLLAQYVANLTGGLRALGYAQPLYIMSSSGGVLTAETAAGHAERTLLSGPVGGVSAGVSLGAALGVKNLITCDMGGTSTDVCLIEDLTPTVTTSASIGTIPFKAVHVDIQTVGAGGGSIACSEGGRFFRVGPESAGARPGPACYGLGGAEPTVTDANLVLGRLGADGLIGGRMPLRLAAAREVIGRLGAAIGVSDLERVAEGILDLAVARMVGAIREVSVQRGHDPREYALVCFGGAGPMHAIQIARELGIEQVLIPRHPGNFSAFGLLTADLRHDYVRTHLTRLADVREERLREVLLQLAREGREQLRRDGVPEEGIETRYAGDFRYFGQAFELFLPVSPTEFSAEKQATAFHRAHEQTYGHARPEHAIELVNLRVTVIGQLPKPRFQATGGAGAGKPPSQRTVYLDGRRHDGQIVDRAGLAAGRRLRGPAIVEEFGSTTVLYPGWEASVDSLGNLRLQPAREGR